MPRMVGRVVEWHGRLVEIPHPYECDKYSGAGNCWCGHARDSKMHPHHFVGSLVDLERCVCNARFTDPIHVRLSLLPREDV